MERTIPIKVGYDLPLGELSAFFKTVKNAEFSTKEGFFENTPGLLIDEHGDLWSCNVVLEESANITFNEDKQGEIFWAEDVGTDNLTKTFTKREKLNYSGYMVFWKTFESVQKSDVSIMYRAIFLNGKLQSVDMLDSHITTVQQKTNKHLFEKKFLLFLAKTVHNVSVYLLQLINNRITKISSYKK